MKVPRATRQQEPLTVFSRLPQRLHYRPVWWSLMIGDMIGPTPTVTLQRSKFSRRANSDTSQTRMIRQHVLFV